MSKTHINQIATDLKQTSNKTPCFEPCGVVRSVVWSRDPRSHSMMRRPPSRPRLLLLLLGLPLLALLLAPASASRRRLRRGAAAPADDGGDAAAAAQMGVLAPFEPIDPGGDGEEDGPGDRAAAAAAAAKDEDGEIGAAAAAAADDDDNVGKGGGSGSGSGGGGAAGPTDSLDDAASASLSQQLKANAQDRKKLLALMPRDLVAKKKAADREDAVEQEDDAETKLKLAQMEKDEKKLAEHYGIDLVPPKDPKKVEANIDKIGTLLNDLNLFGAN